MIIQQASYTDINVELKDLMGSDLTVVNAARVSFAKEHDEFNSNKDERLIKFLAEHNHWSPFAHASLQFKIKAPIFVARQLVKHQVGLSWNEESRRYIEMDVLPEFYIPESWRKRADNKKQGSSDETIEIMQVNNPYYLAGEDDPSEEFYEVDIDFEVKRVLQQNFALYQSLLKNGVAPEQARMVLPQNMHVNWYWTGSLYAFARVCDLRCKPDAQKESRDVAFGIRKHLIENFPVSSKYLLGV